MEETERAKKKEEKGFSGNHKQPSSKSIEKKGAAEEEGWESKTLQDPHNGSAKDITTVLALQYSG